MAAIRKALMDGHAEALAREAHTLKGAVGNFGVAEIVDAARELEIRAREGNLISARTSHAALDENLAAFAAALRAAAARSTKKLFPREEISRPAKGTLPIASRHRSGAAGIRRAVTKKNRSAKSPEHSATKNTKMKRKPRRKP